jgi:predicted phosphodiesterase
MVRKPARKSSLEAAWAALPTEATGLVLSDTHGILTDWDALERALSRESYDFILHAGDFIDFAVDSKYMPYSHTSFEAELEGGARTLLRLEDTGVPVFAVKGNHDDRPTKLAASRVPSYLLPWFRDPLNELVSRIPTLYMPDRPIHEQWYVQLGDILLTHAEAMPGTQSAAGKALSVATMRRHDLGLPGDPIRLVLAGHPHKFRMEQRGQDTTLVDLDMLCTTPQYARVASAMKYQTPTSRGWLTIAVDGDRVDLSDIRHTVDED